MRQLRRTDASSGPQGRNGRHLVALGGISSRTFFFPPSALALTPAKFVHHDDRYGLLGYVCVCDRLYGTCMASCLPVILPHPHRFALKKSLGRRGGRLFFRALCPGLQPVPCPRVASPSDVSAHSVPPPPISCPLPTWTSCFF